MFLLQHNESAAARRGIFIEMVDATDHVTPEPGLTLAVTICKAGASAFSGIAGSVTEVANGAYRIDLAAEDLNSLGPAMLRITATGAAPLLVPLQVVRLHDEVHLLRQDAAGQKDHVVTGDDAGVDRVLDEDGTTVLAETAVAESVAFSGADWINATKRLSEPGAFARYLWREGDLVTLTAGTGITTGQYEIAAKIDDDTIELVADINGGAGDISDDSIAGTIDTGRIMRTPL